MKRIIVLSTLAASMAVMLALAGSAFAADPDTQTFQFEGTDFFPDRGDFEVLSDFVVEVQITTG